MDFTNAFTQLVTRTKHDVLKLKGFKPTLFILCRDGTIEAASGSDLIKLAREINADFNNTGSSSHSSVTGVDGVGEVDHKINDDSGVLSDLNVTLNLLVDYIRSINADNKYLGIVLVSLAELRSIDPDECSPELRARLDSGTIKPEELQAAMVIARSALSFSGMPVDEKEENVLRLYECQRKDGVITDIAEEAINLGGPGRSPDDDSPDGRFNFKAN